MYKFTGGAPHPLQRGMQPQLRRVGGLAPLFGGVCIMVFILHSKHSGAGGA
jgi:hypothetical protein